MKLTGTGRVASPLRDLRRELTQGDVPFALLQTAPERWPRPRRILGMFRERARLPVGGCGRGVRRFFSLTPTPNVIDNATN